MPVRPSCVPRRRAVCAGRPRPPPTSRTTGASLTTGCSSRAASASPPPARAAELWRREQRPEWRLPAVVGDALLPTDEFARPTCVDAWEGKELWVYERLGKGDTVTAVGALPPDRFTLLTGRGVLHVVDARGGDRTVARPLKPGSHAVPRLSPAPAPSASS